MEPVVEPEIVASRRDHQRHEREGAILDAAKALIVERGFDLITMDDIAERTGVSKPTLYKHFGSKDEIAIRAVLERLQSGRRFIASLDPALPAIEKLRRIIYRKVYMSFERGSRCFGPAIRTGSMPKVRSNPEYRREYGAIMTSICRIFEQAKAESSIPAELPIRVASQMVVSILRDGGFDELIAEGVCTTAELATTVVNVLIGGFMAFAVQPTDLSTVEEGFYD